MFTYPVGFYNAQGGIFDVNASDLDGSTQWFTTPNAVPLQITGDMTLAIWMYSTDDTTVQALMAKWPLATSGRAFIMYRTGTSCQFTASSDGTSFDSAVITSVPSDEWVLVIGKLSGTTLSVSFNAGTPVTISHTGGFQSVTVPTLIGIQEHASNRKFEGRLYQPLIIDRATTSGEDTDLYNLGVPKCYAGISTTITDDVVYAPELGNIGTGGSELVDRSASSLTTTNIGSTPFTGTGLTSEC